LITHTPLKIIVPQFVKQIFKAVTLLYQMVMLIV